MSGVTPIVDKLCTDASISKATIISNEKVTQVMENYTYTDMVTIYTDTNGNITMLEANTSVINEITSKIASEIQQELLSNNEDKIYIKIGSFTGIKMFSGIGPSIPVKLVASGTVETKVRSEFESAGVNQTIHRIYLDISCNESILTPYNVIENTITNEIILIENVIVGIVPSTYYNLEGMEAENAIDIIE